MIQKVCCDKGFDHEKRLCDNCGNEVPEELPISVSLMASRGPATAASTWALLICGPCTLKSLNLNEILARTPGIE